MNKQNKDLAYLSNINYIKPIHIHQAAFSCTSSQLNSGMI